MLFGKPIEKCSIEELLIAAGGADISPILDEAKRRDEMVKTVDNPITLAGKYTTRSGLLVRIYAICEESEPFQIHGAYYEGHWVIQCWQCDGANIRSHDFDLIPAKRKAYVWVNRKGDVCASWEYAGKTSIEVEL